MHGTYECDDDENTKHGQGGGHGPPAFCREADEYFRGDVAVQVLRKTVFNAPLVSMKKKLLTGGWSWPSINKPRKKLPELVLAGHDYGPETVA